MPGKDKTCHVKRGGCDSAEQGQTRTDMTRTIAWRHDTVFTISIWQSYITQTEPSAGQHASGIVPNSQLFQPMSY